MICGEKIYTLAGNVRASTIFVCLPWVKESWNFVTSEIVKRSFLVYGISVEIGGQPDNEIHCLKENGVAAAA